MKRAISVSELLAMRYDTYKLSDEWKAAFGEPERNGVWFVWGRSGSGKTSFVLKLCKELCRFGRVAYDSLEEGSSLTMKNASLELVCKMWRGGWCFLTVRAWKSLTSVCRSARVRTR